MGLSGSEAEGKKMSREGWDWGNREEDERKGLRPNIKLRRGVVVIELKNE